MSEPEPAFQVIRETLGIYGQVEGRPWHAWSCVSFCREWIAECEQRDRARGLTPGVDVRYRIVRRTV